MPSAIVFVPSLVAALAIGCRTSARSPCVPAPGIDAGPAATLAVGTIESDAFVPFASGGEAPLVFGPQGGWMLLIAAELPADWADEPCVVVAVQATLATPAAFVDPVELEATPRRYGAAVVAGAVPLFLGIDPDALAGRTIDIVTTVVSRRGRAIGRLSVVLRRA